MQLRAWFKEIWTAYFNLDYIYVFDGGIENVHETITLPFRQVKIN